MIVKLLTEHHLEFLVEGGCRGSSESTLVKMPHCWKFDVTAQIIIYKTLSSLGNQSKAIIKLCYSWQLSGFVI